MKLQTQTPLTTLWNQPQVLKKKKKKNIYIYIYMVSWPIRSTCHLTMEWAGAPILFCDTLLPPSFRSGWLGLPWLSGG